jgi:hypothetical protein
MPPVLFALIIFRIGSCIFVWAGQNCNPPNLHLLSNWADTPGSILFS